MFRGANDVSDSQLSKDAKRKLDEAISRSGNRDLSIIYFIAIALIFFYFVFGSLIPRLFLRSKMGVRTYGIISIFITYFWVKFFYLTTVFYQLGADELFSKSGSEDTNLNRWVYIIASPFIEVLDYITGSSTNDGMVEGEYGKFIMPFEFSVFGFESLLPYVALLIPVVAIFHLRDRFSQGQYAISSYYRGNSLLFGWLRKRGLSDFQIWAFVEPGFLFVLGVIARLLGDFSLGIALQFVAICLFADELRAWMKIRAALLNMSDAQKESEFMMGKNEEIKQQTLPNSLHSYTGSSNTTEQGTPNKGKATMD